jgi:hypothetical protein
MAPLEEKYKIFISKHEMETICLLLEGIAREKKSISFWRQRNGAIFRDRGAPKLQNNQREACVTVMLSILFILRYLLT